MNDVTVMDVLNGLQDGSHQRGSVRFMIVALGTYPVEKFTTIAQVEAKIQVIARLPLLVRGKSRGLDVGNGPQNNRAR